VSASARAGIVLLAHGSADARWAAPFEAVAAQLRTARPDTAVVLAFLERMAPTLADAGARLAADGCTRVDVVPLFLGAGGHVRGDLPAAVAELREAHPGVAWRLHPAIGETPEMVAAMAAAAARLCGPG
jgi:sirohydrochlorin cobaltochelatase